jgi:hypothetical protein
MGNDMTKEKDDGFTVRLLVALVTAMADRNHKDARLIVATLAKEHGLGAYADRVMAQPPHPAVR